MKSEKPNVIVCLTDQLRAFEIGCYGHPVVRTPHIDALAEEGVRFETAVSNNPVCTPARSCILSGQYSRTCTGFLRNENDELPGLDRPRFPDPTLAEVLRDAGYLTALVGKWHVAGHPMKMGFDRAVFTKFHHLNRHQIFFDAKGRGYSTNGYAEDQNHETLDEVLRESKRLGKPFFAYYNIATPHMPFFDVPPEYQSMYAPEEAVLRDNVTIDGSVAQDVEWYDGTSWFQVYMWDYLAYLLKLPLRLPDGFDIRDLVARYYGMVSFTDYHLGLMMEQLQHHGADENTVVVFTSDHGDMLGSHHRYNKGTLYDEAIRVPLIIRAPGSFSARVAASQVASLIDIMPTVLDLAGVACPQSVQGQSLGPVLSGERQTLEQNHTFIETASWQIGVRTPTELYGMQLEQSEPESVDGLLVSRPTGRIEDEQAFHFDCGADPYELTNLADNPRSPAEPLKSLLQRWNAETPWMAST